MMDAIGNMLDTLFGDGRWVWSVALLAGAAGFISGLIQDGPKGGIKGGIIGAVFFGGVAWAINHFLLGD